MRKIYLFVSLLLTVWGTQAQSVLISANTGTSGNSVVGASNYHVSESIYTEAEIGASNFITAGSAINRISYYVNVVGAPSAISSFKVWMKNVPLAENSFTAGDIYNTSTYTLVYDGPWDPSATGANNISLTTPFTRTAGTNLQVLIERLDGATHTGANFFTANGNETSSTLTTCRRYNGTTAPTSGVTNLATITAFRPVIKLSHIYPIDAAIQRVINPTASCYNSTQSIGVVISNEGNSDIAAGAASVKLRIRGANTFNGTLTNTTLLTPGATETITFSGINLNNPGFNYDTIFVRLTGDGYLTNDTVKITTNTASVLNAFPISEDVESTPLLVFPFTGTIAGGQAWSVQSGPYQNDPTATAILDPLTPGSKFYLFDSYNFVAGTASRLYSNCIDMPANQTSKVSFYMSHDSLFSTSLDSIYVSVSNDKGATWTRLKGFGRVDATQPAYVWKKDSVDLSAYAGQTIQVAFEGVSNYGNAIGLDNINISVCTPTYNAATQVACESYQWNGSTITQSGDYTYNYLNATGCPSTDTLHLTINHGTFNSYSVDTTASSYTWNGSTYNSSGTYLYNYTNANGCASTDTLHLNFVTTSVVYPNPVTNGRLQVNLSTFIPKYGILDLARRGIFATILDPLGRAVARQRLTTVNTVLSMSQLPNGVYFLVIQSEDDMIKYVERVVKN